MRGWALVQRAHEPGAGQGPGEEGMAQMQQGLAAWRATGAKVFWPYGLACWPRLLRRWVSVRRHLHEAKRVPLP
jgi:hypothetical protein